MQWFLRAASVRTRRTSAPVSDRISAEDSKLLAYAIPTDEELLIARDTVRVIAGELHRS